MAEVEVEAFHGQEPGGSGYESQSLLGSVTGEMEGHIATLRAPPNSGSGGASMSWDGEVWVASSMSSLWKKKNLFVEGDNLHVSKGATKPQKMHKKISYVCVTTIKTPDSLAQQQKDMGQDVNAMRIMLFTEEGTVLIAFGSQNETEQFMNRVQEMLQKKYSSDELSKKKHASDALQPLISEQRNIQRELGDYVCNELSKSGLCSFKQDMSRTKKQGKLSLRKHGKYVSYQFMVTHSSLRYFHPRQEIPDGTGRKQRKLAGVISLAFMSTIISSHSKKNTKFTITTPLEKYFLKAEHEVSKELWIEALVDARKEYRKKHKSKDKGGKGEKEALDRGRGESFNVQEGNEDSSEGENCNDTGKRKDQPGEGDFWDQEMVPSLTFVDTKGKKRQAVVKPDSDFVIGRSRTCSLVLDDSKVSREHGKLLFKRGENTLTFFDLGSRRGCSCNGSRIMKTFVKPGDEIQLGETKIQVGATAPKSGVFGGLFSSNKKGGFEKM